MVITSATCTASAKQTHYSPFKVAETFGALGALFPNRIDLGVGRAPSGSSLSSTALASPDTRNTMTTFPARQRNCAHSCVTVSQVITRSHTSNACQRPTPCPHSGCSAPAAAAPGSPVSWEWGWHLQDLSPLTPALLLSLTTTPRHSNNPDATRRQHACSPWP